MRSIPQELAPRLPRPPVTPRVLPNNVDFTYTGVYNTNQQRYKPGVVQPGRRGKYAHLFQVLSRSARQATNDTHFAAHSNYSGGGVVAKPHGLD